MLPFRDAEITDLSEEDQMSRAINASLMDNVSEEDQVLMAIEQSLNETKNEDINTNNCGDNKETEELLRSQFSEKFEFLVSQKGDGNLNNSLEAEKKSDSGILNHILPGFSLEY